MTDQPMSEHERMVDRAVEQLRAKGMSHEQLLQYAAAMQVGAAIGVRVIEEFQQVLLGLQAAENAAATAAQFSTRIGEVIAFMDVPPFALALVNAGKAVHAAQVAGGSKSHGARGGAARSAKTNGLKSWALQEASAMKGDDKSIARALAERVPPEHADASKDPERLIYDAIRKARTAT